MLYELTGRDGDCEALLGMKWVAMVETAWVIFTERDELQRLGRGSPLSSVMGKERRLGGPLV